MRKIFSGIYLLPLLFILSGCNTIGNKTGSLSLIYGITALLALVLLVGYCCIANKKDIWFLLLFSSVLVVNVGYYALAISGNLNQALFANRISYLGSVFLPLSMWMIILGVTNIHLPKWVPSLLLGLGVLVFLITASPGYSDIYYKEVYFEKINGVAVLNKVYGSLHGLYLFYLLGYFVSMVATIVYATVKDKVDSVAYATILAIAVFVNIGVWLIEQLARVDFEILSVSYIISECFLLGLHLFIVETKKQKELLIQQSPPVAPPVADQDVLTPAGEAQLEMFTEGLSQLTPKERQLYDCYTVGMSTAQIMEKLNIKENTLKFHNKNLYGKLGVSSRKQLQYFAALKQREGSTCKSK